MKLKYLPLRFTLRFNWPLKPDNDPLFVLRGLLGNNLRQMCCVSRNSECADCMFCKNCVYSFIFETVMDKRTNQLLPGADRASHPFSLSVPLQDTEQALLSDYSFTITLFGKAIEYVPYIYAAFVRAGKDGMFKERIPFSVIAVEHNGENILREENSIDINIEPDIFNLSARLQESPQSHMNAVDIELLTPLRFKIHGEYASNFTAADFFTCLYRRLKTQFLLYGEGAEYLPEYCPSECTITEKQIFWGEVQRYSGRQKRAMKFGGVFGKLTIEGKITPVELALLDFAVIANAGKNTNFGFGQINYTKRME